MNFEVIKFEYIDPLLKAIVLGFLLETLLFFPIIVFRRNSPSYFKELDIALVHMVKHIGFIWLCISSCYMFYEIFSFTDEEANIRHNRMTGPYWFAYWLTSPFMFLLSQLFWMKWFANNWVLRIVIAVLLVFSLFAEKIVIFISSLHRDYLPSSWKDLNFNLWSTVLTQMLIFVTLWGLWVVLGRLVFGQSYKSKGS